MIIFKCSEEKILCCLNVACRKMMDIRGNWSKISCFKPTLIKEEMQEYIFKHFSMAFCHTKAISWDLKYFISTQFLHLVIVLINTLMHTCLSLHLQDSLTLLWLCSKYRFMCHVGHVVWNRKDLLLQFSRRNTASQLWVEACNLVCNKTDKIFRFWSCFKSNCTFAWHEARDLSASLFKGEKQRVLKMFRYLD